MKKQPSIYKASADQPRDIDKWESDFFGSGQLLESKTAQGPQVVDGIAELDNLLLGTNIADKKEKHQTPQLPPRKSFFDVIDQMKVLQRWWDSMPSENLILSFDQVAQLFSKKGIIKDKSTALNYLKKKMVDMGSGAKKGMEFKDFQALFLRGIVKVMVTGIFKEVTKMYSSSQSTA